MEILGSRFYCDKNGLLVRQLSIDFSFQSDVTQIDVFYHLESGKLSALAGQPVEPPIYYTLIRKHDWLNLLTDVYDTVRHCKDRPRFGAKFNHQPQLELFSSYGSLNFIVTDIHGPLLLTKATKLRLSLPTSRVIRLAQFRPPVHPRPRWPICCKPIG